MGKHLEVGTFSKKAIPTEYKGITFKSRSEAFWAVFFDACGVNWQYEEQGYDVGVNYLPDFHLRDVITRQDGDGDGEDFYVEVKGDMKQDDFKKIMGFIGTARSDKDARFQNPMLVVPSVPYGASMRDREMVVCDIWTREAWFYNAGFIYSGADHYAFPVLRTDGKLWITCGDYCWKVDSEKTQRAYFIANKTSFEHGRMPTYKMIRDAMASEDAAFAYALYAQGLTKSDKQSKRFDEALKIFGEKCPGLRKMLVNAKNGGVSGNTVIITFEGIGGMVLPLIERNYTKLVEAFTKVYGCPMSVKLVDLGRGNNATETTQTAPQIARRIIEKSYNVFGRDKIELKEDN